MKSSVPLNLLILFIGASARVAVNNEDLSLTNDIANEKNSNNLTESNTNTTDQKLFVIPFADNENVIDIHINLSIEIPSTTVVPTLNISKDIRDNLVDSEEELLLHGKKTVKEGALLLTPYIKEGKLEEARKASEVNPDIFLGVKSYSGFFTVNETYNSNIFFWYFPVEKKPVNETPWIFWLQGGPGASSMVGVFDEIGPFKVLGGKTLVRNEFTWLRNHSLVFIENPVGTGFSFTNHNDGYATDMSVYSEHLLSTMRQLVEIFPELRSAPLFVSGESYAGKYVPALCDKLHRHRNEGIVRLKGIILGNAYIEPTMVAQMTRPFYEFGIIAREQLTIVQPLVDALHSDIAANRSIAAREKFQSLVAIMLFISHQRQAYNFLQDDLTADHYESFLQREEVTAALHVGCIGHSFVNFTVHKKLGPDFLSNTRPLLETLLEHYDVLAYCGQLDQMLPCAVSSEHYRKWKWSGTNEFLNATRFPIVIHKKLIGYSKSGGRLTEVVFRGAGHMVAMDTPEAAQEVVSRWTHTAPLSPITPLDPSIIQELVAKHSRRNLELDSEKDIIANNDGFGNMDV
ncbi:hypothetical protein ACJJTC_011912 [Scirpophaga incertulas]